MIILLLYGNDNVRARDLGLAVRGRVLIVATQTFLSCGNL